MKKRIYYAIAAIILLFGLGATLDFGISKEDHLESYVHRVERGLHKKESEVYTFLSDTGFIFRQLRGVENLSPQQQEADMNHLLALSAKEYNICLYRGDSLVYWLNNLAFLSPMQLAKLQKKPEKVRLLRLPNGYFELTKAYLPGDLTALAMIPVKWEFSRENGFLANTFLTDDFPIPDDVFLKESGSEFAIHSIEGHPLAWLDASGPAKDRMHLQLVFMIFVLGFIAIGILVNDLAVLLVRRFQPWVGAAFVLGSVVFIRWLIIQLGFTQHFGTFQTFSNVFSDPILEGVNSLGELLINIILLVWMMVFFNREFQVKEFVHPSKAIRFALTSLNFFAINLGLLMVCSIFKAIILDSQIVFDFENVFNLNSQSVLAMVGVVLLQLALFLFSHRMMLAIHFIGLSKNWRLGAVAVSLAGAVPVVMYGDLELEVPYFLMAAMIYLIVFEFFVEVRAMSLQWMVGWLMLFSSFTAMLLYKYNSDKDYVRREEYARALANYEDEQAEAALTEIGNELLSDSSRHLWQLLVDYYGAELIPREEARDIIEAELGTNKYLLHNYDFKLSGFYRPNGNAAFTEQKYSFGEMNGQFQTALATRNPVLHFRPERTRDPGYLLRLDLKTERPLTLYVMFKRSFSTPSKVYTELLLDKKYKDLSELDDYDYGIYQDGKMVEERNRSYGKQLTDSLPPVDKVRTVKHTSTRSELLYHAPNNIVIKIGRETGGYIKPLSLFSYVFTLLAMAVLVFGGINYFTNALPGPLNFFRTSRPSLRNQFQFWVIGMILFSFLGIAFVTVWYFQQSSNSYHKSRLDRKVTAAFASANYEIKTWRKERQRKWNNEHRFPQAGNPQAGQPPGEFEIGSKDGLNALSISSLIPLISEVHRLDVNIYDKNGNLITSSEAAIFKGGLVSDKMGAYGFQSLTRLGYDRRDQDESIGNLQYTAAYLPLKDLENNTLAFMGIPYYSRQNELRNEVTDLMSTLLNVYVFLLLIAGGLAIVVANSITKKLSELGESLQRLRFGTNAPIVWKRKDEIGDLVEAYNQAVKKIEESSRLLAQSERESAWREMAKQVAHEIKNPLTPMKLSIQYLLHAYQSNPDPKSIEPLLKRVTNTLVEQIESLSQIATEFSNFAKMPQAENIQFSLNDLAASVHHLFRNERPDMDISIQLPTADFEVYADRNHVTRVINNLLKNAIQAIPDVQKGVIQMELYQDGDNAILKVTDNGTGIPPEVREKVFSPNFSTKTSGTGLGLAICKSIIEGFNGDIYFETEMGRGTTFFVELPLSGVEERV
ncbi:MAG: GHKL domain-containing protein [Bacteroidetes bacterium]|nr:GHKL domain-containing protein [Bacteroidota bacterium]